MKYEKIIIRNNELGNKKITIQSLMTKQKREKSKKKTHLE